MTMYLLVQHMAKLDASIAHGPSSCSDVSIGQS